MTRKFECPICHCIKKVSAAKVCAYNRRVTRACSRCVDSLPYVNVSLAAEMPSNVWHSPYSMTRERYNEVLKRRREEALIAENKKKKEAARRNSFINKILSIVSENAEVQK